MHPSIGIVIPTFQAARHLPHCLPPLLLSSLHPRVLIIDSSSTDETVPIARSMGAETLVISRDAFNHGTTREMGRQFLNTSIVIMMTQDAYACSSDTIEQLVAPLVQNRASIAYARQLPHQGAGFFGSFSRQFNYPPVSHIRTFEDISIYGSYTFFCSNSCAAYLNCALDEVGGFPSVIFGEDTLVTAMLLQRNHKIAYIAEAEVFHSHDYTLKQEFYRHFDMGLARYVYRDILSPAGKDNQRGRAYVLALMKKLWREKPLLIPYAFLQTLVKWGGYRLGQARMKASFN
ncbi:MAG: glycosyltransferase [Parachlamydiaceae bacterium]